VKQFKSMMMLGTAALGIFSGSTLFAGDSAVVNPKTSEEWKCGWNDEKRDDLYDAKGENAVACNGNNVVISGDSIAIEPSKNYKLSGSFKLAPNSKPSTFFFGIMPINDKGEGIGGYTVAGTETELAADCNPDDTLVKIKNGDKWQPNAFSWIAFCTDSGKKDDLPNTTLSSTGITKIEKKGDIFEVTLKDKCGKKIPAGSKVCELIGTTAILYIGAVSAPVPADWQEFSKVFKKTDCRLGTVAAKIAILANYNGKPDQTMMIKDAKLEEVK
jgi:hypothetical protein